MGDVTKFPGVRYPRIESSGKTISGKVVKLHPTEDEIRDRLMQSAVIFAECLAGEAARNRGVPLTDALRREVAEEIKARCMSKDITPAE